MNNKKAGHLFNKLADNQLLDSRGFSFEVFSSENSVACIKVKDREEFPIYINIDEGKILCIVYLFDENRVKPNTRAEINEVMLMMNVSIPLLAFSKIGNQYIMLGTLSPVSCTDEVLNEIELLSDNVLEAIDSLSGYLK